MQRHDPPLDARGEPAEYGHGKPIKTTGSICPQCLERIDAAVYERNGQVWMDKACADHGRFSALLAGDARHYYVADPAVQALGSCCGSHGCGPRHAGNQVSNHSCNILIEITQRCNLRCPTCYAESSPQRHEMITFERYIEILDGLLEAGKADTDLVQLSGGEPTLHPRLFDMIEHALQRGIRRVYINTNGIKLAQPAFAERLAGLGDRVSVYLQFDGVRRSALRILRGREDLVETKLQALRNCERLGIDTVLVMTLTPGINDDQVGDVLDLASSHPTAVHKLMIQPAMYSGRYEQPRLVERSTLAEAIDAICAQARGGFCPEDFSPIPCSDPNCFSMALALRTEDGFFGVSRYFPRYADWAQEGVADLIASVSDSFDDSAKLQQVMQWVLSSGTLGSLLEHEVDELLDRLQAWQAQRTATPGPWAGTFAIGIKPFMDAYTFDQDRIDKCCVHIISSTGEPVSFCEYNAIHRPRGIG